MNMVTRKDREALNKAVQALRSLNETKLFFHDLLSEREIQEIACRWKVARMIWKGTAYTKIIQETGLSSRTIARVARCVRKGAGGYKLILKREAKAR
jgi:TrpR-related protein YerC/YecD